MDTGAHPINDAGELRQVRRQARAVHVKAFVSAAALTAILLIL
jgi:hypothetical protein